MKILYRAYEQYCCVLKRNIVLEETTYDGGSTKVFYTNYPACQGCGGCQNSILKNRLDNSHTQETVRV